jgi:SAM-dependent MidA family methyltransferase
LLASSHSAPQALAPKARRAVRVVKSQIAGAMIAVVIASVAATTVTPLAAASPVLLPRAAMRLAVHRAQTVPTRIVARNLSHLVVIDLLRHAATNLPTHLAVTSLLVIASARSHPVVTSPLMHLAVIVAIVPKVHAATILSPAHAAKAVLLSTVAIAHPQTVQPMQANLQHAQDVSSRLAPPHQAARLSPHAVIVLLAHPVQHVLARLALRQAHVVALTLMVVAANPAISISADALAHSQRLRAFLHVQIQQAGGWLPFSAWMHHVLYAPGLGYYAAGNTKLADAQNTHATALSGDFVTAPQLTPLFGYTIARQVAEVLRQTDTLAVLEFGAGSGALAHDLLTALDEMGLNVHYNILEVSADLKQRQQERLAAWGERVTWLETLPIHFAGCVVGNELLDAMPVELFVWSEQGQVLERGIVSLESNPVTTSDAMSLAQEFAFQDRPASPILTETVRARMPALPGYTSEINLQAEAWIRDLGRWLTRGAALLIDYGFPRHEYYHPQRQRGTLMCHIQHRTHDDVFLAPGLQDITAHIDFTAIAEAAQQSGLDVLGYTSQARFLLNAGLPQLLETYAQQQLNTPDSKERTLTYAAVQKLISEAEMGELFKVIVLGRGIDSPLSGFTRSDRSGQLYKQL